jgi:ABC-type dipeptide/oligopeptide/nickel transport system permease subunit
MTALFVLIFVTVLAFSSIGFGVVPGWWDQNYYSAQPLVNGGTPTLDVVPAFIDGDGLAFAPHPFGQDNVGRDYFALTMRGTQRSLTIAFIVGLVSTLIRGEFLSLREKEFVEAARAMGASNSRIIVRHILPNSIGTIIVNATLTISAAILLETSLSYLGFGVLPPDTSLGLLVSTYQGAFATRPWLFWWPGVFIILIALTVNFIGDGLRDAFDPKQNRVRA